MNKRVSEIAKRVRVIAIVLTDLPTDRNRPQKAFEQAGAKSVMASLWSAEDRTTREIMGQFYKNLQQGMDKTEALRQAKLTQNNSDRHPFFWSPFILIDNGD